MDNVFGIEIVGVKSPQVMRLGEGDIYHVLETIMGLVPEEDVDVIQMLSPHPRRVDVSTKCLAVWSDRDLFQFMDKQYELNNGKRVWISKPFDEYTTLKVKRIPVWWSESTLERILSYYGDVKSIKKEIFRSMRDNYKGIYNGNYNVKMKVKRAIPSTITVSGTRFEMYYYGQKQTCWVCGKPHLKENCDSKSVDDHVNKFDIDAFPPLPESPMANPQNDTEEETASMNGMDTSMDGTTTKNVNENATTETVSENATDSGNGINSVNIDNFWKC